MTGTVDERLAAALLYHNVHETLGSEHCSGYCASDIAAALADSGVVLVERAESLDAAWAEAEAALPDGWMFDVGSVTEPYGARAAPIAMSWPIVMVKTSGPTPAAALRSLAAALRESR